jgi:hypothetical protein
MKRVYLVALLLCLSAAPRAASGPEIWFCPGPGTLDYTQLFQRPEEWRHAREAVSVFKFYQQHTSPVSDSVNGPNTYDALARAGAFSTLTAWGKKIALEVGAVKEFYCTSDASGMNRAIADTVNSVQAVERAGGKVSYLAMDDPFAAGRAAVCGGPALEPTADRIATYVKGVRAAGVGASIGMIEAYPFSSEAQIETMLDLLKARGASPAFLHMDIDLNAIRVFKVDMTGDLRRLKTVTATQNLPFGIIIWGNNGDADALYAADAGKLLNAVAEAFPTSKDLPDQVIVQSWAESRTGLRITPTNLPEDAAFTHTNLLWEFFRRLHGMTGAATGTATPRRH